jgi:hypothetical protein
VLCADAYIAIASSLHRSIDRTAAAARPELSAPICGQLQARSRRRCQAVIMTMKHDPQALAAQVIRQLFLATGRDVEAVVYGLSEALLSHDDLLAEDLERAMLEVLARRGPRLAAVTAAE